MSRTNASTASASETSSKVSAGDPPGPPARTSFAEEYAWPSAAQRCCPTKPFEPVTNMWFSPGKPLSPLVDRFGVHAPAMSAQVGFDHLGDQLLQRNLRRPTEHVPGLGGI